MKCTDPQIGSLLEGYVLKRITKIDSDRFEDHLFECKKCRIELQDEEMLRTFTLSHRDHFSQISNQASLWSKIKSLIDSIIDEQMIPALPLQFRKTDQIAEPKAQIDLQSIAWFIEKPENCFVISGSLVDNRLTTEPMNIDDGIRDAYLLISPNTLFPNPKKETGQSIQDYSDQLKNMLCSRKTVSPELTDLISKSHINTGRIEKIDCQVSGISFRFVCTLSLIAQSYLKSDQYTAILILH